MLEVVKRALDRYTEPKPNESFTHVILSEKEYNKKQSKILDLQEQIKRLERDYNASIERYKKSANDKIAEIQTQANKRISDADGETLKHKETADSFQNMNRNLIRVATERANAQRDLTPKKQHIGYILLSADEFIYNCECFDSTKTNRTKTLKLPCFRVRLQSPYTINFDFQSAKDLITEDFKNKKIYSLLGIAASFNIQNWSDYDLKKLWDIEKQNFDFKISYKANFQKGFWEVEYYTRFMVNIPTEMMVVK